MLTLCIDTAYKNLALALIRDDEIVASYNEICFKKQSETVFVALEEMFRGSGINKRDIDSVCIALGPGSYTGVRIAMTIAKVYCSAADISLYGISTLRLYAGNNEKTMVVMDARAGRAYVGIYDKDKVILKDCAKELTDIGCADYNVILDGALVNKENTFVDIPLCFMKTKNLWEKIEDIDHLTPLYLKESDAYYR